MRLYHQLFIMKVQYNHFQCLNSLIFLLSMYYIFENQLHLLPITTLLSHLSFQIQPYDVHNSPIVLNLLLFH